MTWETYLLYLAAIAAFFAHPPGPSQLLMMSHSIQHGIKSASWTIFGDLLANSFQMIAAAFGLAALIATSAEAFLVIKWLGVAYLAWIGFKLFFSKPHDVKISGQLQKPRMRLFRQGFITSSANPYAVIFFAALFPQFIDPVIATLPQVAILGLTYLVVDGIILVVWGYLAIYSTAHIRLLSNGLINRVSGFLMICAAAILASRDISLQPQK